MLRLSIREPNRDRSSASLTTSGSGGHGGGLGLKRVHPVKLRLPLLRATLRHLCKGLLVGLGAVVGGLHWRNKLCLMIRVTCLSVVERAVALTT